MANVPQTPAALAAQIAALAAQNPAAVELPETYCQLGALHYQAANYREALSTYGQALVWQEQHLAAADPSKSLSFRGLGLAHHALGDYAQAEQRYQQSVQLAELYQDVEPFLIVPTQCLLIDLYCLLGRYQQAHDLRQRALPLAYKLLEEWVGADLLAPFRLQGRAWEGNQYDLPVLSCWHGQIQPIFAAPVPGELGAWDQDFLILGRLYRLSNSDIAVKLYEACLVLWDASKDNSPLKLATPLSAMGEIYASRNQDGGCGPSTAWLTNAEPLVIRALAIREEHLAADHPLIAASLTQVADVISPLGRYREALTLLERAVAINERCLGDNHLETAISRFNLAAHYQTLNYREAAVRLLEPALEVQLQILGPEHPRIRSIRNLLALVSRRERG